MSIRLYPFADLPAAARRSRALLAVLAALAALAMAACGGAGHGQPPVLRVGDVGYTRLDVGALTGAQQNELGVLTGFGLATAAGRLPQVLAPVVRQAQQQALLTLLAREVEARAAGITDADLRRIYRDHPQFQLTVRHLVLLAKPTDPESVQRAARQKAEAALARIRAGAPFAKVAAQVSQEPGASSSGGLLPPGRKGTWVEAFWKAALALKPGQVSGVVRSPYGYHVIKLLKRDTVPFSDVRGQVLAQVLAKRGQSRAAQAWARKQYATMTLEPDSIQLFRSGAGTDSMVLAHWPSGRYTVAEFKGYRLTLDQQTRERLQAATPDVYDGVVEAAAHNALLAARARAMGLAVSEMARDSIAAARLQETSRWASALGFSQGESAAGVKAAALKALGATDQDVSIARQDVMDLGASVERLYSVERPASKETGS